MSQEKLRPDWRQLLQEALERPGTINQAYSLFHRFSLGNGLWVMSQMLARGIEPGPVASFLSWKKLGRGVRKGEHALTMWMPVMVKDKSADDGGVESVDGSADSKVVATRRIFVPRAHWFALSQTDPTPGVEAPPAEELDAVSFDLPRAASTLGVTIEPFESTDGNRMGYSRPAIKTLAVSPLAFDPLKTVFHEMAHCLLHAGTEGMIVEMDAPERALGEVEAESVAYLVCCTLGHVENIASCRGYIQTWIDAAGKDAIPEKNIQRIFSAANKILGAGQTVAITTEDNQQAAVSAAA